MRRGIDEREAAAFILRNPEAVRDLVARQVTKIRPREPAAQNFVAHVMHACDVLRRAIDAHQLSPQLSPEFPQRALHMIADNLRRARRNRLNGLSTY